MSMAGYEMPWDKLAVRPFQPFCFDASFVNLLPIKQETEPPSSFTAVLKTMLWE